MPYRRKIVLNCPKGLNDRIDRLVEEFIRDGVAFVAVVGEDCAKIEGIIDELVVGDGSDDTRDILTSSRPGVSLSQAVEFALSLTGEFAGDVEIVEL
jgi:hypothetical protein